MRAGMQAAKAGWRAGGQEIVSQTAQQELQHIALAGWSHCKPLAGLPAFSAVGRREALSLTDKRYLS